MRDRIFRPGLLATTSFFNMTAPFEAIYHKTFDLKLPVSSIYGGPIFETLFAKYNRVIAFHRPVIIAEMGVSGDPKYRPAGWQISSNAQSVPLLIGKLFGVTNADVVACRTSRSRRQQHQSHCCQRSQRLSTCRDHPWARSRHRSHCASQSPASNSGKYRG